MAGRNRTPWPAGSPLPLERPGRGTPGSAAAGPGARAGRGPNRRRGGVEEVRMSAGHPLAPILAATPPRHPMLLLDRLESVVPGQHAWALKAVSANEMHFVAAGPAAVGMPPTLLVDALGQLAIVVLAPPASERGTALH